MSRAPPGAALLLWITMLMMMAYASSVPRFLGEAPALFPREAAASCTMLVIAHRSNTIADRKRSLGEQHSRDRHEPSSLLQPSGLFQNDQHMCISTSTRTITLGCDCRILDETGIPCNKRSLL